MHVGGGASLTSTSVVKGTGTRDFIEQYCSLVASHTNNTPHIF